jgi:hypothetical protein
MIQGTTGQALVILDAFQRLAVSKWAASPSVRGLPVSRIAMAHVGVYGCGQRAMGKFGVRITRMFNACAPEGTPHGRPA